MAFDTVTLAKAAFKAMQGKANTNSAQKDLGNEAEISGILLTAQRIIGEEVAFNAPATAVSNGVAINCTGGNALTLVLDNTSNGKAYFVKVPAGSPLLSVKNPFTGVNYVQGDMVRLILNNQFGDAYRPILKNNGTEIPPLDSKDWYLDSYAGIVTSEDSLALGTGTLECYVYSGKMITEAFSSAGGDLQSHIEAQAAHDGYQIAIADGYSFWPYDNVQGALDTIADIFTDVKEPTGIVGKMDAGTITSAFSGTLGVDGKWTITLTPTASAPYSGSLEYYIRGEKTTISSAKTIELSAPGGTPTDGVHFVYFDDDTGTLKSSTSAWGGLEFAAVASVATVYVKGSTHGLVGNELHGISMDSDTHSYLHNNFGSVYRSGFGTTGYTLLSDVADDVSLGLENGIFSDEDLNHSIAAFADNVGGMAQWYRETTTGKWISHASPDIYPFHWAPSIYGNAEPQYNPTGTWGYSNVPDGEYCNYYLLATNMSGANRVVIIPGQVTHTLLASAQAEGLGDLSLGDFIVAESCPLWKVTILKNNSYTNASNAVLAAITDIRKSRTPSAGVATGADHGSLAGRASANSHPIAAIGGATSGYVLFGGASGQIAEDAGLTYNAGTDELSVAGDVKVGNTLKISDGDTNFVTIDVPSIASDYSLVLPTTAGTDGYVLKTDGSGNLAWIPVSGGAGFAEDVEDTISGILTDTNSIDWNQVDGSNQVTADVKVRETDSTTMDISASGVGTTVKIVDSDTIDLSIVAGTGAGTGLKADIVAGSIYDGYISTNAEINRSKLANGTTAGAIIFNDLTANKDLSEDVEFTYDPSTNTLSVPNVSMSGSIDVPHLETDTLHASSDVFVEGHLEVDGYVQLDGYTTVNGQLEVTSATHFYSTQEVDGASYFNSTVDVDGAVTLNDTLDVDGATTLNSTLDVDGATTLNSTLDVDGYATFHSGAGFDGYVNVDGVLTVGGATDLNGTLNVASSVKFESLSTGVLHSDADGDITSSLIVDADVDANAAIAWTKIDKTGSSLNDLADVTITTPATNSVLVWNGSAWVDGSATDSLVVADTDTVDLNVTAGTLTANIQLLSIYDGYVATNADIARSKIDNGIVGAVVFNDNSTGYMSEDAGLTYDSAADQLSVTGSVLTPKITNNGNIIIDAKGSPSDTTVQIINSLDPGTARLEVDGYAQFFNGVSIAGDLTVLGTTVTLDVQQVTAEDNLIVINEGETGAGVTKGNAGIVVDRGTAQEYGFFFQEISDTFRVGEVTLDGSGQVFLDYTQAVATREDTPQSMAIPFWNATDNRFDTENVLTYESASNALVLEDGYIKLEDQTSIKFGDSDSTNFVTLVAPATVASDVTFTLPAAAPVTTGFVMVSDTSGNLSFVDPATTAGFTESVEDIVGALIEDSNSLDWTYTDEDPSKLVAELRVVNTNSIDLTVDTSGLSADLNLSATATAVVNTIEVDGLKSDIRPLSIKDGYVAADAAIAGTKIVPDFGSQTIVTTGDAVIGGHLEVDGYAQFDGAINANSTLDVDGATTLNSTLDVDGYVTLNDKLSVAGTSEFWSATHLMSTLEVEGQSTFDGYVVMTDKLSVEDSAEFFSTVDVTGATHLLSTLEVEGQSTFDGYVIVNSDIFVDSNMQVSGTVLLDSTLTVVGMTDLQGDLKVDVITESTTDAGVTIETVLVKDGLVDGYDISLLGAANEAHIADSVDPHGAWMSVSVAVETPMLQYPGNITIDGYSASDTLVTITNSDGTGKASLSVEDDVTVGGDLIVSTLNPMDVVFVGTAGLITGEAAFNYDSSVNVLNVDNVVIDGYLNVDGYATFAENSLWTPANVTGGIIDWKAAQYQTATNLSADAIFTFQGEEAGMSVTLLVSDDGTQRDLNWPVEVIWANGQIPAASIVGESIIVNLIKVDSRIFGSFASSDVYYAVDTVDLFSLVGNSEGLSISDNKITLHAASSSTPGAVSTGTQSFAGAKTFTSSVVVDGSLTTKTSLVVEDPGVGTNKITIQSPTLAGDYTLTLPVNAGNDGDALIGDGAGNLSWSAAGSVRFAKAAVALDAGDVVFVNSSSVLVTDDTLTNMVIPLGMVTKSVLSGASHAQVVANNFLVTVTQDFSSFVVGSRVYWDGSALVATAPTTSGGRVICAGVLMSKNGTTDGVIFADVRVIKINA